MIVDDVPISEIRMARAKEHEARRDAFGKLVAVGHVKILLDCDPEVIRVQVEDEIFTDARTDFPSIVLMARLQLAIAAGQSSQNSPRDEYDTVDAMRYAMHNHVALSYDQIWVDEVAADPFMPFESGYRRGKTKKLAKLQP